MNKLTTFTLLNTATVDDVAEVRRRLGHTVAPAPEQPRGPYTLFETAAPFADVVAALGGRSFAVDVTGPDGGSEHWENPAYKGDY